MYKKVVWHIPGNHTVSENGIMCCSENVGYFSCHSMAQEAMNKGIAEICWTGLDCKGWGPSKIIAIKATQERTEELNKAATKCGNKVPKDPRTYGRFGKRLTLNLGGQ